MKPSEYFLEDEDIIANQGRTLIELKVSNSGDRPVQVGSHFHFFEVNRCLIFDREKSLAMRLNIPSGTSVRFEPGQTQRVELCALGGTRTIFGFNNLVDGRLVQDENNVPEGSVSHSAALSKMKKFCDDK